MNNNIMYTNTGETYEPHQFSTNTNYKEEEFRRTLAFQTWAQIFTGLGIGYYYKPKSTYKVKEFASEVAIKYVTKELPNADFFLPSADVFAIVKLCTYAYEAEKYQHESKHIMTSADRAVVTCYADGRFRLTDYVEGNVHDEELRKDFMEKDAVLSKCTNPECELYFFHTLQDKFLGCRHCGHNDRLGT